MSSLRNPNHMSTHPGAVLPEDVLPELGWTQTEFAARLMLAVHQRAGFACKKHWIFGLPR
jgi:hypothetical protein